MHSPTPWYEQYDQVLDNNGTPVFTSQDVAEFHENQKRIVCCINVLANIPTGDLEAILINTETPCQRLRSLITLIHHYCKELSTHPST